MPLLTVKGMTNAVCGILIVLLNGCSAPPHNVHWKKPATKTSIKVSQGHSSTHRRELVLYALGLLGVNYRFGGNAPEVGLDCSGLITFIYKNALGIDLPRNAAQIAQLTKRIARHQLKEGDLVFFNTRNRAYSHVGLYIGDNKFIHAPSSGRQIKVASLDSRYFADRFNGAGTLFN